jgi:hypothetical protein
LASLLLAIFIRPGGDVADLEVKTSTMFAD